jgi:hypothetical protein
MSNGPSTNFHIITRGIEAFVSASAEFPQRINHGLEHFTQITLDLNPDVVLQIILVLSNSGF